ncbi:hypothetical protein [Pseudomonas sp. CGJS7]|uniref:hypothetical protein n=1 Tax=Pseudomonas sp. CGJS7 TaxID=3109348 RepID=UPI00300AD141
MFVAATAAFGLSACGTFPHSKTKLIGKDGDPVRMVDFPSERRGGWVVIDPKSGQVKVCSEPFSDTGLSTEALLKLTGDIAKKGNVVFDSTSKTTLKELQGRTPSVLALRDVMYRMCERRLATDDGSISKDELDIYRSIVEVIAKFADAERNEAATEKAKQTGDEDRVGSARAAQDQGFEALASCSWDQAESAFARAESLVPGFQISYEMARALRMARAEQDKRDDSLKAGRFYMPADVKKKLEKCP